jgi:hypothetical protein
MRYNSQRQEFFASNGRVTVTKEIYSSGFYEYVVKTPTNICFRKTSQKSAEVLAKKFAYQYEFAFNPIFDYDERQVD